MPFGREWNSISTVVSFMLYYVEPTGGSGGSHLARHEQQQPYPPTSYQRNTGWHPLFDETLMRKQHPVPSTLSRILVTILAMLGLSVSIAPAHAAPQDFPSYQSIRPNVAFWAHIYGTHSINSVVIHDRNDLSIVYEVVHLMDRELPAAAKLNESLTSMAVQKYQTILRRLSEGKPPATGEERRVAQLFAGKDGFRRMAAAIDQVRPQLGQRERFLEGVVRSGMYMTRIRAILAAHGLPPELAYLPHVESSFNNGAYSKAGASGMWQFTRGTGKNYLRIDDAVDERSDPFLAADAAARYLKDGFSRLGSWPLALTAYNYGTAGMVRAKEAKGSYERIFREYDGGYFGFASKNFYAEFLAAMQVARKLESSPNIRLAKPVPFIEYTLPGYVRLDAINRHFHLSSKTIKELNPALLPPVYSGGKLLPAGYRLRLPATRNTQNLIGSMPRSVFSGSQTRDRYYTVRPGETLTQLAARYTISVSALAAANGLPHNAKIRIGQRLRIPPSSSSTPPRPRNISASDNKRVPPGAVPGGQPLVLSAETAKIEKTAPN